MQFRPVQLRDDSVALHDLLEECRIADGHHPLGEAKYLDLVSGDVANGWVLDDGGRPAAYAHAVRRDDRPRWAVETVFHPTRRDPVTIENLLTYVLDRIVELGGGGIRIWVYHPAVAAVVDHLGFSIERELLHMRMPLPPAQQAGPRTDVRVSPFRPSDGERWVAVNNRAFAGHPENGSWTLEMFEERTRQPWFDPAGLLMVWHVDHLVGFCWTKVHPERLGEIYVVGVDPEWQGRSLGKYLTLEGLWYLHAERRALTAMLYVDASEARAVGMYTAIGFRTHHVDRSFTRSV